MIVTDKTSWSIPCRAASFAAALLLAIAFPSMAAEPAPTLDELLTQAMDENPGVIAAEAKMKMAEAELRNVRFEVARQLVACWNEVNDLERAVILAGQEVKIAEEGSPDESKLRGANTAVIDLKAKLARARSELLFLTGRAPVASPTATASNPDVERFGMPLQIPHGPLVEKIREALNAPTQIEFADTPVHDVADYLRDLHSIEVQVDSEAIEGETLITLSANGMPLGAALQLWGDKFHGLELVVRDYGILVTTPERAREAGYMPLAEFARLGTAPKKVSD